jgi:enediyne biosynthesis protein E4
MRCSRRSLLKSAAVLAGANLTEALATPVADLTGSPLIQAHTSTATDAGVPVTFVDVAQQAGLSVPNVWGGVREKKYIIETKGSGIAFFDYDNDGWQDIYLTNGMRLGETYESGKAPTSHLYKNNRDGTFTDVIERSGLARTGWQTGVCVGDYDNDGWDDLLCCFWGHNILFHNNGDGTFTDVTHEAGLYEDRVRWGTGCTWLDYDRDGFLDLFVANYIDLDLEKLPGMVGQRGACQWHGVPVLCGPQGLPAGTNSLYHNNGDGTFTDVSEKAGIHKPGPRYSITAVSYDFDNDGWPDIYVAVDTQASLLFHNNHNGTFTERAVMAGCALSEDGLEQSGMGVGVGDYDCDGLLDIVKTNFINDSIDLYHNNGDGTFTEVSNSAGAGMITKYVNWGAGFVDFDNDGWPDIFYVTGHVYPEVEQVGEPFRTPRVVYRNLGNGKFADVSAQMGPGIAERFSSRGCAFGDFDNDGDVDVLVLNLNDLPSLLRNDGGNKNNWIRVKLLGTTCNRTAIGARVRVVTGKHAQTNEVASGTSVMSQSDLRLHFGLGRSKMVDLVEVKWPTTQKLERFTNVAANQTVTIKEGAGLV